MTLPLFYGKPLEFSEARHTYKLGGVKLPGVTTICGLLDKPQLQWWAAGCAVDAIARGEADPQKAYIRERMKAGQLGTAVHTAAVELLTTGHMMSPFPSVDRADPVQLANAFCALRAWHAATQLQLIECERRVVSEELGYAGTADLWGIVNGQRAVLDFKTGGVYDDTWAQPAGYELALREELKTDEPITHILVHLDKKTGEYWQHVRSPSQTRAAKVLFKSLVATYYAKQDMPKAA